MKMTRLIDADAMLEHLRKDPLFPLVEQYGLVGVIDAMPTVDAIPIEYIFKQIIKLERSKGQSYHAICYRHLIEAWAERKENDTDRMDNQP